MGEHTFFSLEENFTQGVGFSCCAPFFILLLSNPRRGKVSLTHLTSKETSDGEEATPQEILV